MDRPQTIIRSIVTIIICRESVRFTSRSCSISTCFFLFSRRSSFILYMYRIPFSLVSPFRLSPLLVSVEFLSSTRQILKYFKKRWKKDDLSPRCRTFAPFAPYSRLGLLFYYHLRTGERIEMDCNLCAEHSTLSLSRKILRSLQNN